jgi:hypothetical protein
MILAEKKIFILAGKYIAGYTLGPKPLFSLEPSSKKTCSSLIPVLKESSMGLLEAPEIQGNPLNGSLSKRNNPLGSTLLTGLFWT